MTQEENWNPGHSTNKGYPFAQIESRALFVNRPNVYQSIEDNKIYIEMPGDTDGVQSKLQIKGTNKFEKSLLSFLFDTSEALKIAEGQIVDILHEDPFTPETFGFQLVHKNTDITEPPVRIYVSKFDESVSLFKKPVGVFKDNYNPALWTLMRKQDDGSFKEIEILLPCHRIAYAAFYALGVKVEFAHEELEEQVSSIDSLPRRISFSAEQPIKTESSERTDFTFCVLFTRGDKTKKVYLNGQTTDKNKALTEAKFILETDNDDPELDIKFSELSIV